MRKRWLHPSWLCCWSLVGAAAKVTDAVQDEGQLNAETEHEWAQALLKIRKKDPSIYDAATRLFQRDSPSDSSGDADAAEKATGDKPKKSKKTLRAILYDQVCWLPTTAHCLSPTATLLLPQFCTVPRLPTHHHTVCQLSGRLCSIFALPIPQHTEHHRSPCCME